MEPVGGGLCGAVLIFQGHLGLDGLGAMGWLCATKGPFPGAGETQAATEGPCLLTAHSQPAVREALCRTASQPGSHHAPGLWAPLPAPFSAGGAAEVLPRHLVGSLTPGSGRWSPESGRAWAMGM